MIRLPALQSGFRVAGEKVGPLPVLVKRNIKRAVTSDAPKIVTAAAVAKDQAIAEPGIVRDDIGAGGRIKIVYGVDARKDVIHNSFFGSELPFVASFGNGCASGDPIVVDTFRGPSVRRCVKKIAQCEGPISWRPGAVAQTLGGCGFLVRRRLRGLGRVGGGARGRQKCRNRLRL